MKRMQFCALVLATIVFAFPTRSYQSALSAAPQAAQPLSRSIHDIEEAIDDADDSSLIHNNNEDSYDDDDYNDDYEDQDGDQDSNTGSTGVLSFLRELKNVTRHAGKTVKFLCEVQVSLNVTGGAESGGEVKVTWRQNEVVVDEEEEKRFKVRNTEKSNLYISILRISQLDPFDKGFYSCQAQRGSERIKSEAFLEVVNKWGAPISNIPQIRGGNEELTTLYTHHSRHPVHPAITEPPQTIQPALPALHEQTVNNPLLFDTKHTVNAQQAAAVAGSDGGGGVTMLTTQTTTGRSSKGKGVYDGSELFCQMYSGKVCSHLLGDRYVFIQPPMTQQRIEESLSQTLLVVSQSNDMSLGCSHYAIPSLCYSAFPLCLDHAEVNRYQQLQSLSQIQQQMRQLRSHLSIYLQRICKRDCTLLVTEVCNKEYAIARRHPVIGKTIQLEECEDLPVDTTASCIKLDVEQRERDVDPTDTCYWDDGRSYRGPIDVALSGDKCLRWGEVAQMQLRLDDYPELIGHNYCRNPDHASEPYCYTHSDPRKRHPCGLPRCARLVYMYLGGAACILTALVTLAVMIYCCKRRKSSRGAGRGGGLGLEGCGRGEGGRRDIRELMGGGNLADKNIYGNGTLGTAAHSSSGNTVEMNALLPNHHNPHFQRNADQMASLRGQHHRDALSSIPVYTNSDLTFVEELGEGAFGKVFKARLNNPKSTPSRSTTPSKSNPTQLLPSSQYVAVKSLKENANAKTQADFQREIELLAELQHPNIICLVGVVSKGKVGKGGIGGGAGQPHCMLFEYMELGDLHQFMVQRGARAEEISNQQCLQIGLQIALGMEYLADNHYVHRDLAARNCLVSHNLTVKIADFGLSRDMYSCDYYRVQSKSLLPVRWMPPESILYGKFSTESDVWSFGVVLWEVWSVGLQPYYGFNNQEVIGMIRNRQLLSCPEGCPSYCYALMVECWAELAVRRPTFPEICHRLRVWRNNVNQMALQSQRLPTPSNPTASLSKQHQHHLSYNTPNHLLSNPPPSGSSDYSAGYHSTSTPNHHQPLNNSANSNEAAGRSTVPGSGKHQRERHHSTSNISAAKNNFGVASGAAGGSQHSLTSSSHGSSLGTRTQSTNLSLDRQGRRQQQVQAMQLQLSAEPAGMKMKQLSGGS